MALECHFSDISNPHYVFRRHSPIRFRCYLCTKVTKEYVESSYYCSTCKKESHIGCYKFQPEIKNHPYHPIHSLELKTSSNSNPLIPNSGPDVEEAVGECKCCRRQLQDMFYHCCICKFSINATCALNPPEKIIKNERKYGDTTFHLFPRHVSLPCDACGMLLNNGNDHVYTCLSSNYIAHGKCIKDLPSVIKLTRHPQRLSHTPLFSLNDSSDPIPQEPRPPSKPNLSQYPLSLFSPDTSCLLSSDIPSLPPSTSFSCGVCQKTVNVNYGHYSCKKDCRYVVHSKCATREDVWDMIDLKEMPEEPEEDGGMDLFKEIADRTILHCNHEDVHLKFPGIGDGSKFCQACLLIIVDSDSFYSCKECEFVLHKSCALLSCKIDHPLHKHRLTLLPFPTNLYLIQFQVYVQGMFNCSGCHQRGSGFMYKCTNEGCRFQLDVRCASLVQPFNHGSHRKHPLFMNMNEGRCNGCDSNQCSPLYLECNKCNFFLGLKCATLPTVAHYDFDRHPLTLCYGEEDTSRGQYWCELCESKLDASRWFYACDSCRVTIHVRCLLGKEVFMKPNHVIEINDNEVNIVRNNGNPRPFCGKCGGRCVDTLVLKSLELDTYCCTLRCMQKLLAQVKLKKELKQEKELEETNQGEMTTINQL